MAERGPKVLWKHAITAYSSTDDEMVGQIRDEGRKMYRWIKNASGAAFVAGGACYHTFSNGSTALEECTDGVTIDLGFFAGIAMSAIPNGSYGFIQIFGYHAAVLVTTAGGTIVAGDMLLGVDGADDMIQNITMGTAPVYTRNCIAMEAMATAVTVFTLKCMIQALG